MLRTMVVAKAVVGQTKCFGKHPYGCQLPSSQWPYSSGRYPFSSHFQRGGKSSESLVMSNSRVYRMFQPSGELSPSSRPFA